MGSDLTGSAGAVAIYQASQSIYDVFDRATVLYQGRQIYFGPAKSAKAFFEAQGWFCPQRQTTGDFLTSITNPQERKAREGMEDRVPRTPDDFEQYWRASPEFRNLQIETEAYEKDVLVDHQGESIAQLRQQKNEMQSKHSRPKSPYIISVATQVRICTKRAYQRIWNDLSATGTQTLSHVIVALVVGSVFYGTPDATEGFFAKGSVLFLAGMWHGHFWSDNTNKSVVLINALTAISEVSSCFRSHRSSRRRH